MVQNGQKPFREAHGHGKSTNFESGGWWEIGGGRKVDPSFKNKKREEKKNRSSPAKKSQWKGLFPQKNGVGKTGGAEAEKGEKGFQSKVPKPEGHTWFFPYSGTKREPPGRACSICPKKPLERILRFRGETGNPHKGECFLGKGRKVLTLNQKAVFFRPSLTKVGCVGILGEKKTLCPLGAFGGPGKRTNHMKRKPPVQGKAKRKREEQPNF